MTGYELNIYTKLIASIKLDVKFIIDMFLENEFSIDQAIDGIETACKIIKSESKLEVH